MIAMNKICVGLEWMLRGRRKEFSSRAELEAWQSRKVLRMLQKTLPLSAALRQRFAHRTPKEWRLIEPIGKTEMMESFDCLVTRPVSRQQAWEIAVAAERSRTEGSVGALSVGMSSGTSGQRGLFVVSPGERARWAGAMLGRVLGRNLLSRHRIALLLRANSGLYETLSEGRISFRYVDILQPPDRWMNELSIYDPTIIAAPPSILRQLAEHQQAKPIVSPRTLYSVAEVLDETDRALIKQTWGAPLYQIYQATEGFLGISADEDRLILNEDLLVVEQDWIDRQRKLFAPVITDFSRTTQPIVRYRLDDMIEETDAGAWKPYRAVSRIHGRITDMLYLKTSTNATIKVSGDLISRAIISVETPLLNYEIMQREIDELIIAAKWPSGIRDDEKESYHHLLELSIREWCTRAGFIPPACRFTTYAAVPSPLEKYRRVRQCMDIDPAPEKQEAWA